MYNNVNKYIIIYLINEICIVRYLSFSFVLIRLVIFININKI